MKQHPILFSKNMVKAILIGTKTQTRRVVKLPMQNWMQTATNPEWFKNIEQQCPYGQPGDVLWVRESYCKDYFEFGGGGHAYKADYNEVAKEYVPQPKWKPSIHMPKAAARIWLQIESIGLERVQQISEEDAKAEGVENLLHYIDNVSPVYYKYDVKKNDMLGPGGHWAHTADSAKHSFQSLWLSINGHESWEANPYVWVLKFKVLSTTGKPENI